MIRRYGGARVGWACGLCSGIGVVDVLVNPGAAVAAQHRAISPTCLAQPRPEDANRVELWTGRRLVALMLAGPGAVRGLPDLILVADAR